MASYKLDQSVKYAKSHEWARADDGIVVVGISDYAQDALSDVVYIDLPEVGDTVTAGKQVSTVESVKAAEDVNAPVSGEVVEINTALEDTPEIVNERPYDAWFFKVKPTDKLDAELAALLAPADYEKFVAELE
ncbi:MAG: glycine cleavage system protein GcvH [Caldilinea sp.]|uniref:glycine cleavage system protein GcvH n=1 Tax=Caldilinea sp. TaxID=2293560 RepID=UPI002C070932|nr:glycine cleavage system protein GcvH [Anaerolineales bacterium]HQY94767.1 glycine cleavage system protein GcvH [Caldilinea sp.]HRA66711.1 glycine cleavage system protein GcvH [Caldilinea sp.]